ncbi:hypothetical protein AB1N83_011366 [Pleurotus pulmonarius]
MGRVIIFTFAISVPHVGLPAVTPHEWILANMQRCQLFNAGVACSVTRGPTSSPSAEDVRLALGILSSRYLQSGT